MDPYRSDARAQERIVLLERLRLVAQEFVQANSTDPGFPFDRYVELMRVLDELTLSEREH